MNGTERRFAISRNSRWLPKAPDASKSYDDPNAMYSDWYGWQTTLNHEQKINDNLSWFLNAGMNDMTNRRMIYRSQITIDDMGDIKDTQIWSQYFLLKNKYAQAGLKWKVHTGAVEHNLVFSVDRSHRIMYNNNTHMDKPGQHVSGNIYTGIRFDPSIYSFDNAYSLGKMFMYQEMDTSLNFMDTMKAGKWSILAAGTRRHGNYRGKKADNKIKDNQFSPTFGVSYQPNENLSFYGAYAKSTTRGVPVSDSDYQNNGEILDAVKVTQKEVGVKYKWDNMYAAISYFDTTQPQYLDVKKPGFTKPFYLLDGKNHYKGIDFNMTGQIAKKWNVFGGFEYLNAKVEGGTYDGCHTDSSAKWSAVLGMEYMPNADWSISGRMNYVGRGIINRTNKTELEVPSSTVVDLFAKYKTSWGDVPVTLSAGCYNVFNRSYWALQPGQGNKLLLSSPRSFILSASFDF